MDVRPETSESQASQASQAAASQAASALLTPVAHASGTLHSQAAVLRDVLARTLSGDDCVDIVELSGGDVQLAADFATEYAALMALSGDQLTRDALRQLNARRLDLAVWRALKAVPAATCMVRCFAFHTHTHTHTHAHTRM